MSDAQKNKDIVHELITEVFINGNMEAMPNYFDGDKYIQHNLMVKDGLSGLGESLGEMAKMGITMVYKKIHFMMAEGDKVLVVSEGEMTGKPTSFYDIFRLENGKIAEHWDNIEGILPQDQWQNQNGKFGF